MALALALVLQAAWWLPAKEGTQGSACPRRHLGVSEKTKSLKDVTINNYLFTLDYTVYLPAVQSFAEIKLHLHHLWPTSHGGAEGSALRCGGKEHLHK